MSYDAVSLRKVDVFAAQYIPMYRPPNRILWVYFDDQAI